MSAPAQQYYINGKDLWVTFGVALEKGSTSDFLKFPEAKETIEHDWMDSNGIDVDLSRIFYKQKTIAMKCFLVANNEAEWWTKYNQFFAELTLPGLKRFEISEFSKSFYIYYKDCSNFSRFTRIKNATKIVVEFTLTVIEQEPKFDTNNVFLIDETGRFIVT